MKLNEETFNLFKQIQTDNKEIQLINVYKGIPISYPGTILAVYSDALHIKTGKTQMVCLYRERETYIQIPYPQIIRAKIKDLNLLLSEAILYQFEYINKLEVRTSVRVEPREPVRGKIASEGREMPITCTLADISMDGLGLFIDAGNYSPIIFAVGNEVNIHISIPLVKTSVESEPPAPTSAPGESAERFNRSDLRGIPGLDQNSWLFRRATSEHLKTTHREIVLNGKIVNSYEDSRLRRYRAGIMLNPGDPQRDIVSQFIVQRQTEILREIRQLSSLY